MYDALDPAYEDFAEDDYLDSLREEIATELEQSAIERIRETIFKASDSYRPIVQDSIRRSTTLRHLDPPDHLGAFFHTYRAIDAYLDHVVMRPMLEVVLKPIAHLFTSELVPFKVLSGYFKKDARDRVLSSLCVDSAAANQLGSLIKSFDNLNALRNRSFHGFAQPDEGDATMCEDLANSITLLIEEQRLKYREGALKAVVRSDDPPF